MRRPGRTPPQWAGSSANIAEPLTGKAATGYIPDEIPPAAWFNYHFNQLGQWAGFLAGPSQNVWTPRVFPDASTGLVRGSYDASAFVVDTDEARFRYAVVGEDGTGPFVAVSRRGTTWVTRRNLPASPGSPLGIYRGDYWYVWTDTGLYSTRGDLLGNEPYCSLREAGYPWDEVSLPGSPGVIASMTSGPIATVASSSTKILYTFTGESVWHAAGSPLTDRQIGRAAAWTGLNFVDLSSTGGSGIIYTATNPAGTWTLGPTLTGVISGTSWQLASGDYGEVIAFKTGVDVVELWRSTDHGVTWTAVTSDASLRHVTALRWNDGVWIATSTVAPYAQTSGDLEHWLALPIPVGESGNELRDVVFGGGSWLLVSRSGVLQGAPAIDPGSEGYTPGTAASIPGNAGWLRGVKISLTAPTDGQVPTYNLGLDQWVPATPAVTAAYTVRSKTTTYTALAGDVLLCDATSAAFTVTLPAAATVSGQSISVKKTDASANAVTVDGNGSETIDGATTLALATRYAAVTLWSDGSNWWVF